MFSEDFSLTYELFKHNSLFKFDKFSVPSAMGKEPPVCRKDISLSVLLGLELHVIIYQPYIK